VIQAIQFLISRAELSASLRYACLYPVTLGCMLLLCAARDRDDRVVGQWADTAPETFRSRTGRQISARGA